MPVVECPSGLKVELRGLTVAEEDILLQMATGKAKEQDLLFRRMLTQCVVSVADSGPYTLPEDGTIGDLDDLLTGDRFALIVHLRRLSYGDEIQVQGTCPNGHAWDAQVDLSKMEMYALPGESRRKFLSGENFIFTLPSTDRKVEFGLATGHTEGVAARRLLRGGEDVSSESLRMRIKAISGFNKETGIDEETGMDMGSFIRSLPIADAHALRDAMDEADCGMETEFESVCDVCDVTAWVSLERALNFFTRGKGRKRRGSRASRS